VFRDAGGWVIVDYKTDQTAGDGAGLVDVHHDQLMAYATAWRKVVRDDVPITVGLHAVRPGKTHWIEGLA
jgi:ATP-dependent exoDNAse (exonuclease V) beta subunit